jgi:hypothetical protein
VNTMKNKVAGPFPRIGFNPLSSLFLQSHPSQAAALASGKNGDVSAGQVDEWGFAADGGHGQKVHYHLNQHA